MGRKVARITQRIRWHARAGGGTVETAHDRHHAGRSSSACATGGFTLIEMLFVLFLVAMITA
ncbi:MAG: prepilin-type N-terminal cleavage/methylation domain-containing protein, partial [Rhodospirillaceae bacterium]|nr:prepilin-type N-terminal cleavage/methylation domain-containing protein [Rhodospirillaceae bacterium]